MGKHATSWLALLACLTLATAVRAQISLPSLLPSRLPAVAPQTLPDTLTRTVDRSVRDLAALRTLQIRDLLREHRRVLDADPDGAPVVRGEIVAIDPGAGLLQQLLDAGFSIRSDSAHGDDVLDVLQLRVVVLRAPETMTTRAALALAQRLDPSGSHDYNHLFLRSAATTSTQALQAATTPASGGAFRIGLIDSGVDRRHPALADAEIRSWGCDGASTADAHGTAVASLLAGNAVAGARGRATLYAADVYCGQPTGGAAAEVTRALAWLARERVGVVNLSLVGPPNRLLERAIARMTAQGHLIVAAVGNDGPAAPPLYPAAYPDVVGVTAVNARNRVLPESGRGPQVDFAAPGADMIAATPGGGWDRVRGTSYAAPIVARLAARQMDRPDAQTAADVLAQLAQQASTADVGRGDAYGRGLLGTELRVARAPSAR